MAPDPQEVYRFKKALSKTPVDVIARNLNDNVILRSWKRELAEAEITRRGFIQKKGMVEFAHQKATWHTSAQVASWIVTFVLVCLTLAVGYFILYRGL